MCDTNGMKLIGCCQLPKVHPFRPCVMILTWCSTFPCHGQVGSKGQAKSVEAQIPFCVGKPSFVRDHQLRGSFIFFLKFSPLPGEMIIFQMGWNHHEHWTLGRRDAQTEEPEVHRCLEEVRVRPEIWQRRTANEGNFMGELEETWKLFHHSVDSQVGRRVGYEIYEPRKHCRRT